ncbi:MAG: hypothetical protein IH946_12235, partial [Bacteroidetes bacterium]|nr:hypothetical protein [Bacteroidota bacterium]
MMERYKLITLGVIVLFLATCANTPERKEMKSYYDDDKTKLLEEFIAIESGDSFLVEGIYKSYYEEGGVREESHYKEGKLEGVRKLFNKEGKVIVEENYTNGDFHGPYKSWWDNGNTRDEGSYDSNQLIG